MGIKQYTFFSLIFIVIVGIGVYSLDGATYTLNVFSKEFTYPIAFWIIVPLILLFLATILHLIFYSIKNYFKKRVIKKDYETLLQNIKDCLINEEHAREYKSEYFKNISKIIKRLNFNPEHSEIEAIEPKFLNEVIELLDKIYNGEYVDIKKLKLRNDNPITLQNRVNILNADEKTFLLAFKQCTKSSDEEFCQKAYEKFASIATFTEVKKQGFEITSKIASIIFDRYLNEDEYTLSNDEVASILEKAKFTSNEYVLAAKTLKQKVEPDILLALFEKIHTNNHIATDAYLYLLFEFQMIDKIKDILDNSEESEYEKFKILLFLRDSGKNIDADLII